MSKKIIFACLLTLLYVFIFEVSASLVCAAASLSSSSTDLVSDSAPGDRIRLRIESAAITGDSRVVAAPITDDYVIGSGDALALIVKGKGNLNYPNVTVGSTENNNSAIVTPSGELVLPLIGTIDAAGLTIAQLREKIALELSKYYKNPEVSLTVTQPRLTKIWVSGEVDNPGPIAVSGTATILEVLLKAGIRPRGSTRLIQLTRNGQSSVVDVYAIVMKGDLSRNITLQPGDTIFVPVAKASIDIEGEVVRPGRFETVAFSNSVCRVSDAIQLCLGLTPAAVPTKASIERKNQSGSVVAEYLDVEKILNNPESVDNIPLQDGDRLRIPAIGEFQSVIRMVGEFIGHGVYQRVVGPGEEEQVLNKSGVYRLAQGETAGRVIRKTGGWTPQADLKRASVERQTETGLQVLALDLEKVLIHNESSADILLQNGDTLVLPANVGKVQMLGQVNNPGAYTYVPGRRLMEYIGEAGGPRTQAKLSQVTIIHKEAEGSIASQVRLSRKGSISDENNPILSPGDIVFIPQNFITDWREVMQILTSYRLIQTIF